MIREVTEMLKDKIKKIKVLKGNLAVFYLGQAGFVFKTSRDKIVYIDPYLSDVCERLHGFKRLIPAPISADDINADMVICTHEHTDHLDIDAIPIISKKKNTKFIGPIECVKEFRKIGIGSNRIFPIKEGKRIKIDGLTITGIYADHGKLSKDAVGILLNVDGINLYYTGDTAYRPERIIKSLKVKPDIIIPVINGKFGNLNSVEAAKLSKIAGAKITIGCHFGMFAEHNGKPAEFIKMCKRFSPGLNAMVMKPSGLRIFRLAYSKTRL